MPRKTPVVFGQTTRHEGNRKAKAPGNVAEGCSSPKRERRLRGAPEGFLDLKRSGDALCHDARITAQTPQVARQLLAAEH